MEQGEVIDTFGTYQEATQIVFPSIFSGLYASMSYFSTRSLCIGSMLDLNVFGICLFMLSFVLQLLFSCEHRYTHA